MLLTIFHLPDEQNPKHTPSSKHSHTHAVEARRVQTAVRCTAGSVGSRPSWLRSFPFLPLEDEELRSSAASGPDASQGGERPSESRRLGVGGGWGREGGERE